MSNNKLAIVGIQSAVRTLARHGAGPAFVRGFNACRDGDVVYVWIGARPAKFAHLGDKETKDILEEALTYHIREKMCWTESVQKAVRDVWNGGRA